MSEAQVRRWQAPPVADGARAPARGSGADGGALTAERLAAIEALARQQGLAQGRAEGLQAGHREGVAERHEQAERLRVLLDTLTPQLAVLDDGLLTQLADLVAVAVRQFVRRELTLQPGEVVRVLRECLAALPASDARVRVHLHPADAELVREALQVDQFERPWSIVEDLNLQRGGCRLDTETSTVDATVETRLNVLLARLLGDARRQDDDG
jgi:flagellar assembly protein FliH